MKNYTITATIPAFISGSHSLRDFNEAIAAGKGDAAVNELSFSYLDMDVGDHPWVRVGEAQITVTMDVTRDQLVAAQVRVLQKILDEARAEFAQRQAEILSQINKLQALTFSGGEA